MFLTVFLIVSLAFFVSLLIGLIAGSAFKYGKGKIDD